MIALDVFRFSDNGVSTLGLLFVNGQFRCYTLEDGFKATKVKGETRIPAGTYALVVQEAITPLTEKYRSKHAFFDKHLHVKDVPNFESVYIHIGNTDKNTDGCLLLGDTIDNNAINSGFLGSSTPAFKRVYEEVFSVVKQQAGAIRYHDECSFSGVFRG